MRLTGEPLIVITGPTAAGKTGLALEIAEALNAEIIGADSRQVYRKMDIGTAKPLPDELRRVPHHLIDIVEPDENLTLAEYQRLAYATIQDVLSRARVPLLVGGTAQYINAVIEGWSIPEVAPNGSLRTELEAFAAEHGSEALHQRLAVVDPSAAAKIEHQNVRRVVRALEVYMETGQPISELQRKHPPPYRFLKYVLTMDREALYERADRRVDAMIEAGFVEEVRRLLEMGYSRKLPSMSGLGYAQIAAHLEDGVSLDTAIAETKIATHKFIRHQYTWFRKYNRDDLWHNMQEIRTRDLLNEIVRWLNEQENDAFLSTDR
jgi:tRNA dimethylallyltransferase